MAIILVGKEDMLVDTVVSTDHMVNGFVPGNVFDTGETLLSDKVFDTLGVPPESSSSLSSEDSSSV